MKEQLALIQSLRVKIDELIKLRDENENQYRVIDDRIENTSSNIQNIKRLLKDKKDYFIDQKTKRLLLFNVPIGIICAAIIFFSWNGYFVPNGFYDYILATCVSGLTIIGLASTSFYLAMYDKLDKPLIKIFPKLKNHYNEILSLKNDISRKQQEIINMKQEQNNLKITFKSINDELEIQRKELESVEKIYFDSLVGKTITIEESQITTIDVVDHGKRKIKVPYKNEKLGN